RFLHGDVQPRDALVVIAKHALDVLAIPVRQDIADRDQVALLDLSQLAGNRRIAHLCGLRRRDRANQPTASAPNSGAICLPLTAAQRNARPGGESVTSSGGIKPIWRKIMALSK